jgi:hypothetical protein
VGFGDEIAKNCFERTKRLEESWGLKMTKWILGLGVLSSVGCGKTAPIKQGPPIITDETTIAVAELKTTAPGQWKLIELVHDGEKHLFLDVLGPGNGWRTTHFKTVPLNR